MESLSPPMQMLAILGATRALVVQSCDEGFSGAPPQDCASVLDQMMASIINPEEHKPPDRAGIQFAPTGPLQEIAMSNGWHDAYLILAGEYDRLEEKLNLFPSMK